MMQTRCPSCQTLFRVTPEQLKARQGRVRCGHCQTVFDALDALEDEAPGPAAAAATEVAATWMPPEPPAPAEAPPAVAEVAAAATEEEEFPPPPEPAAPEDEGEDLVGGDEALAEAAPELEPALHEEEPRRRAWPWVLGILAALAALGLQAIYQLRVELAVLYPATRPALQSFCAVLGCDIPLPRKIDLLGIETSDLHPDAAGNGRLQLVAVLRNRAPFTQPWPHLEVTLTDVADHALVRRVFLPAEYLPAGAAAAFAARGEQSIQLALEAPEIAAVGYRLYIFYP